MKRNLLLLGLLLAVVGNAVAQEPIAMDGEEWNVKVRTAGWEGEEDPNNVNYTRNVRS